jgi:hypothetical protein
MEDLLLPGPRRVTALEKRLKKSRPAFKLVSGHAPCPNEYEGVRGLVGYCSRGDGCTWDGRCSSI